MLVLNKVSLERDGIRVLRDISATAGIGQLTTILGPNGAGKSSLLATIAGELAPLAGSCYFNQQNIHTVAPQALARRRAMLPQLSSLEFEFTAREVARLGAIPFPEIAEPELGRLCDSILHLTDSVKFADRHYPTLSGGERQRAQLARVLVQACAAAAIGPALLLLDEPTASLDPRHQHLMLAGLAELCRNIPLAVVASVHDVNLALAYADNAWLINEGQLVAAGQPASTLTSQRLADVFGLPARNLEGYIMFELPR